METVILGTGSNDFSNIIEMQEYGYNDILDCKVKVLNIFTKRLSQNEVAVFGDYQIFIFFKHGSNIKVNNYKVKIIKKSFYLIIPYEEVVGDNRIIDEKDKVIDKVSFQPSCKLNFNDTSSHNPIYQIEVYGVIDVSYVLEESSDIEANNNEIVTKAKEMDEIVNIESKEEENSGVIESKKKVDYGIMESEKNEVVGLKKEELNKKDNCLIDELMNLDLEALKKLGKINYSNFVGHKK